MAKPRPLPRSAAFDWNGGAWAGSLFGGTSWLLFGAIVLFGIGHPLAGLAWTACFGGALAVGLALWNRRRTMKPYPAVQTLIWSLAGFALVAALSVVLTGADAELDLGTGSGSLEIWLCVLVFPALSLAFLWKERRAARKAAR